MALSLARAATPLPESLVRREWKIEGETREALVYAPAKAKTTASPVIFVFHGHNGTMTNAAHTHPFYEIWPDAIVVYAQGLKTPGRLTDLEGKLAGWQHSLGVQHDRDVKLFDAMLATLKQDYRVDPKRIYVTGHSNGGAFTYLLWAARGDVFAAVAPSSAAIEWQLPMLKPKPVLHAAGTHDPLVKFEWQQATIDSLRKLNQCGPGEPWEKSYTLYPSKIGAPVVALVHPGTHKYMPEATALIAKFFQAHALP